MRTRNSLAKGTDLEEETKSEKPKLKKKNVKIEKSEDQGASQGLDPPRRSRRVKKENSSASNQEEEWPEDKPGPSGIQNQKTKSKNTSKASKNKLQVVENLFGDSPSVSKTSKIPPRKIHPSLQRNKISRSATPSSRLRVKAEIAATQLPPESEPMPDEMPDLLPELIPEVRAEFTDERKPSNSLENKNDSSIPKQETKKKKVKEEKKPVMNGTDNGTAGPSAPQNSPQNASIIEVDDIDGGVRAATECIVLSDLSDSDDGIQVIGEVRKARRIVSANENSLVDLTNDPVIDPKPGPSGLQAKNR